MPATIKPADVSPWSWPCGKAHTTGEIFKEACSQVLSGMDEVGDKVSTLHDYITPDPNGFFNTIFHAYSNHYHLVLRPDDVWFAILVQLNFYINAHAEELRSFFVSHDGKRELKIVTNTEFGLDVVEIMVVQMSELMKKHITDPAMIEWATPSFSTTTESDKVVAAVLIMGTLKKYFNYALEFRCGFPSVTLLGEREDWVKLQGKLDKIPQLGTEPTRFASLLQPVLGNFVSSFDQPESPVIKTFWNTCVKNVSLGSGSSLMTGWLTTFCFWDQDGKPIHQTRDLTSHRLSSRSLAIATCEIPSGITTVPVTVNNLGEVFETKMVAGSAGIEATSEIGSHGSLNTVRPWVGWSLFRDGFAKSATGGMFDYANKPEGLYKIPRRDLRRGFEGMGVSINRIVPPLRGHEYDADKKWVYSPRLKENWRKDT